MSKLEQLQSILLEFEAGSSEFKKGDKVVITGNSIFKEMGHDKVSGEIFLMKKDGFHFKCKDTGAMEIVDFGDGKIEKVG